MEEINIKEFWDYYKRYLLIVILVVFFCVLSVFVYDIALKKPLYSTYTTVVLVKDEGNQDDENNNTINQSDIMLNQKLVSTYREIIKSRLVLEQVIEKLNLDYTVSKIKNEINVQAVSDTAILKITVTDFNAKVAADIANVLADIFDQEITKLYKINNVSVIDKALTPSAPSNNNTLRDIVLIGLLSFVGSSAIIFIIFYFDDTLRTIEEIDGEMNVPVIAKIFKDNNGIDLVIDKKPNSIASESIRTLRTNLQFSSVDKEVKTILITSSVPGEGKSFISANLAVAFAQNGKKVLIVDVDLRKGRLHKIFNVVGKEGLSNLLISDITNCTQYISTTKIKNLYLMPRGIIPPNPSELLNSKKNESLINLLKKHFDIVIFDGAPINGLSDSLILSSYVDKVLLVCCINHTPKTELKNTIKSLQNVNANLAGFIANNVNTNNKGYGKYYYYGGNGND